MTPFTTGSNAFPFAGKLVTAFVVLVICSHTKRSFAQSHDIALPLQKVVFTKFNNPPSGWTKYDASNVTATFPRFIKLKNVSSEFKFVFRAHALSYLFTAPSKGYFTLRLGLYEHETCDVGKRIAIYTVNGASSPKIDLSLLAGCKKPYYLDIPFFVSDDKAVTLSFIKLPKKWAPVISNFRLFADRPFNEGYTPEPVPSVPSVSPSPDPPPPGSVDEILDLGPGTTLPGTKSVVYTSKTAALDTVTVEESGLTQEIFSTAITGIDFSFSFDFPPGTYDVTLGFIELQRENCKPESRVFDVYINGIPQLKSFDIVKAAGACRRAIVEIFSGQAVDPLSPKPFTIRFVSVAKEAIVSYIRVKATEDECAKLDETKITEDHLAHAVPGSYPSNGDGSFVDTDGKGFVLVKIDGTGSHTHFSNQNGPGKLVSYTWTLPESGKLIASTPTFNYKFPLGSTRLKLTVLDNACSRDEAETTISVTGNILSGIYCYYYSDLVQLPRGGQLTKAPLPTYAESSTSPNFGFPSFPFSDRMFVTRCIFFIKFEKMFNDIKFTVNTAETGHARLYKGDELIVDSETSSSSEPTSTSEGLSLFELIYLRTDIDRPPSLKLLVNDEIPKEVFYDRSTVLPIVTSIDPPFGGLDGGGVTKINGYGLSLPVKVFFGNSVLEPLAAEATSTQISVIAPPSASPGNVEVYVNTPSGLSSSKLTYEYGSDCDPIQFDSLNMKKDDGSSMKLEQPTAISIWQDGQLYVGSWKGFIYVINYDEKNNVVTSTCHSETLIDTRYVDSKGQYSIRSILGLTFDPRDKFPRPYVSTSTLFWKRTEAIKSSNKKAWSNGAVERFKPASVATKQKNPNQCLEYDKNIVQNLPVSDGDHSVNELVFTQYGDLLIGVGGSTNAGLPFINLGGTWDSYFSAAIVIAHTSRGSNFNGTIIYSTPENLRTANPLTDDVELYATGTRNPFSMSMTRNGDIYAIDMGANCRFGNVSSSCSQYNEEVEKNRSLVVAVPIPGFAIVGPEGECKFGDNRPDKLIEVKAGKFYGHSNLPRAKIINAPSECVWIDPNTGLSPPPAKQAPPSNYEHFLVQLQSPMTGFREYGSNLFCGKLRGDFIISVYQGTQTFRLQRDEKGTFQKAPTVLHQNSALRVEETVQGSLILPRYSDDLGVVVLRPRIHNRTGLFISNALPFRHGQKGGTTVIIGGWGFQDGVSVLVGTNKCEILKIDSETIACKVPPLNNGKLLVDVKVSLGMKSSILPKALLYMEV